MPNERFSHRLNLQKWSMKVLLLLFLHAHSLSASASVSQTVPGGGVPSFLHANSKRKGTPLETTNEYKLN